MTGRCPQTDKVAHVSRGAAHATIQAINRERQGKDAKARHWKGHCVLVVYRCRFCGNWHIGNTRQKPKKRAKIRFDLTDE